MGDKAVRASAWSGGALVAVSAAVGAVVGARAIVRVELPRLVPLLGLDALPREGLGVAWSERALWPADLQGAALERLLGVVVALALAAALVATFNAVVLLAEAAAERRAELAVRSAVGAKPSELALLLLRSLRALLAGGVALGLVLGLAGGGAVRALWPDATLALEPLRFAELVAGVGLVAAACLLAYVHSGWRMATGPRVAELLRAGVRGGADPMAVFVRKVLTALHTAVAGAVVVGTLALAGPIRDGAPDRDGRSGADSSATEVAVFDLTSPAPDRWEALRAAVRAIPGVEAESLAAPGALLGLGIREIAIAECGNCSRGLMPAPLWNALADHHAVGPGYFDLAGMNVVSGRAFTEADHAGAEPVALVNETFARTAFERGRPIGKRVRVGADFGNWYTVVGVVEDVRVSVLGADETPRAAVYLSALQQPPRSGTLLVRGEPDAVASARVEAAAMGFAPRAWPSVSAYRRAARDELRWSWIVAALAAVLTSLLAAHGVYAAALQTTRRRTRDIAIRRAVGATPLRTVAYVLGERLRVVAWGLAGFVFLGTLTVALLQNAAGMPHPQPLIYAAIAAMIVVVAAAASSRAAREALAVEPARVME